MTAYELKRKVIEHGHSPYFFDRKTMRFFGDTMSNYGVVTTCINGVECYELYRRKPVKHGLQDSAYFDANTFRRVHPLER